MRISVGRYLGYAAAILPIKLHINVKCEMQYHILLEMVNTQRELTIGCVYRRNVSLQSPRSSDMYLRISAPYALVASVLARGMFARQIDAKQPQWLCGINMTDY